MGAAFRVIGVVWEAFKYGSLGWMVSDYFNESKKAEQVAATTGQPKPEPWSIAGSILGANWKNYLLVTVVIAGIIWIVTSLINKGKKK